MITFNNFQRAKNSPIVDITLPTKSIIHLDGENVNHEILHEKPFCGEVLYNQIPIFFFQKSFLKKMMCKIIINEMFAQNLTLLENLHICAEICNAKMIKNAPIKYFEIPNNLLNKKIYELENDTINLAELGLLFYFGQKISMIANVPASLAKNEKALHLIKTRVENGNDMIIQTGKKFEIPEIIQIPV